MTLGIDIDDTLRAFTAKLIEQYKKGINESFDLNDSDIDTNNYFELLQFKTLQEYNEFLYTDYAYEIYGCATFMNRNLGVLLNSWINKLSDYEDKMPNLVFFAVKEGGLAISSTLYFLSKTGCAIRNLMFPTDSLDSWNYCDALITANPFLLENKPEGKISIKINAPYNKDSISDYTFNSLADFLNDNINLENNILKI
jgi:hypothetical protein